MGSSLIGARVLVLMSALVVGCGSEPQESGPTCGEVASSLVMECSDELENLVTCIEVSGVDACDAVNLAHGRCLDMVWADVDEDLRDPAHSRYLCEVDPTPADDCAERIAACPD